jgi:hypothetical protein
VREVGDATALAPPDSPTSEENELAIRSMSAQHFGDKLTGNLPRKPSPTSAGSAKIRSPRERPLAQSSRQPARTAERVWERINVGMKIIHLSARIRPSHHVLQHLDAVLWEIMQFATAATPPHRRPWSCRWTGGLGLDTGNGLGAEGHARLLHSGQAGCLLGRKRA